MELPSILLGALILLIAFFVIRRMFRGLRKPKINPKSFPQAWRRILRDHVAFYKELQPDEQTVFELRMMEFLHYVKITGIKTEVSDKDRVLIAASAVMPIFRFPGWMYPKLDEIILYPGAFNLKFDVEGPDRRVLGVVGEGVLGRKMALSRQALQKGFSVESDKRNTAVHEFLHLLDMSDGAVDGLPKTFLDRPSILPWTKMMYDEMAAIREGKSDIRPYGAANEAEFFSVVGEYFFERPELLERKHPELYAMMEQIFKTPPSGTPGNRS